MSNKKYPFIQRLNKPIVIVDEDYFDKIKQVSELNTEQIKQVADTRYAEYLETTGINIKVECLTDKRLLYNDLVKVTLESSDCGWYDNVNFKDKSLKRIVETIEKYANQKLKPVRGELLSELRFKFEKDKRLMLFWRNLSIGLGGLSIAMLLYILMCLL